MEQQPKKRLKTVFLILIAMAFLSFIVSSFFSIFIGSQEFGNVAVIPIRGIIRVDPVSSFGSETASSTEIIEFIEQANKDSSIQAIIFDINSPGGSAVASQEITKAIKKTNKTTIAVIREVGASGGYWIASATDYSIANEMSITGSIGVIGSYIEFAGLMERYNLTYQRLVGGKYKDLGTPLKSITIDEKSILQNKINKIHDIFIRDVAENREMSYEDVKAAATGEFYLGMEALELNLIDATGDIDTAKEYLEKTLNITDIQFVRYVKETSIFGLLSGVLAPQSYMIGKGIGSELKNTESKFEIIT